MFANHCTSPMLLRDLAEKRAASSDMLFGAIAIFWTESVGRVNQVHDDLNSKESSRSVDLKQHP